MCTLEPPVSEEAFSNKGEIDQFPDVLINYLELYKVIKTIFSKFSNGFSPLWLRLCFKCLRT